MISRASRCTSNCDEVPRIVFRAVEDAVDTRTASRTTSACRSSRSIEPGVDRAGGHVALAAGDAAGRVADRAEHVRDTRELGQPAFDLARTACRPATSV